MLFICAFLDFTTIDNRIEEKQKELAESIQKLEQQQQQLQAEIEETRELLKKTEKQIYANHILIMDIRNRFHLDLEAELEMEKRNQIK